MLASILNAFMRARSVEATLVFLEEEKLTKVFMDILEILKNLLALLYRELPMSSKLAL